MNNLASISSSDLKSTKQMKLKLMSFLGVLALCLFFIRTPSVYAIGEYPETVLPQFTSSGGTFIGNNVLAVSDDERYVIVYTHSYYIDGVRVEKSLNNLYLKDMETSDFSPFLQSPGDFEISPIVSHIEFLPDSHQILFVSEDKLLEAQNSARSWMYQYDINSQNLSYISVPEAENNATITQLTVNGTGEYVYTNFNGSIYQFSMESGSWAAIDISSALSCETAYNFSLHKDYAGDALFSYQCGDQELRHLGRVKSDLSYESLVSIASNTQFKFAKTSPYVLVKLGNSELRVVHLEHGEETPVSVSNSFGFLDTTSVFDISPDGRSVIFSVVPALYSDRYIHGILLAISVASGDLAVLSTDANGLDNGRIFNTYFAPKSNNLYFYQRQGTSSNRRGKRINVDDHIFVSPEIAGSAIFTATEPFKVNINTSDFDDLLKIERTHVATQTAATLYGNGQEFEDFKLGLQFGVYHYRLSFCSRNLICTEPLVAEDVDVLDFDDVPELSVSFQSDYYDYGTNTYTVNVADYVGDRKVKIRYLKEYHGNQTDVSDSREIAIAVGNFGHLVTGQYCIKNKDNSISCSGKTSEILEVKLPSLFNFHGKVLPDYSGVGLSWDVQENTSFELFRQTNNDEEVLIYSGSSENGYIDQKVSVGDELRYRLRVCNESTCVSRRVLNVNIRRRNSDGYFDVHASNYHYKIEYSTATYWDQISLYRQVKNGYSEPELVTDLSWFDTEYEDYTAHLSLDYEYYFVACYQEQCREIARREDSKGSHDVFGLDSMQVENLSATPVYMGHQLQWDPVPGADGYRVLQKGKFPDTYLSIEQHGIMLRGEDNTSLMISEWFGSELQYQVQSYVSGSRYTGFSEPTTVSVTGGQILGTELVIPTDIDVNYQGQSNTYELSWKQNNEIDYYEVYVQRGIGSEPELLRVVLPERLENRVLTISAESYVENESIQFGIRACSRVTNICSEFSKTKFVVHTTNFDVELVTLGPTVTWDEAGFVKVVANIPDNSSIERVIFESNVGRLDSYNGRTWEDSHQLEIGMERTYTTRYCFRTPGNYGCSDVSESTSIVVPEGAISLPVEPSIRAFFGRNNNDVVFLKINYQSHNDAVYLPQYFEIYRSVNFGREEKLVQVLWSEFDGGDFIFEDMDLPAQASASWYVRACNDLGCSDKSNVQSLNLHQFVASEVPPIPAFTLQSGLNTIRINPENHWLTSELTVQYGIDPDNLSSVRRRVRNQINVEQLIPNTSYFVQLAACNELGCSEFSDLQQISTLSWVPDSLNYQASLQVNPELWHYSGTVSTVEQRLDAFAGDMATVPYIDLSAGGQLRIEAFLANDAFCPKLLQYSLPFGKVFPRWYEDTGLATQSMFEIVKSDVHCRDGYEDLPENQLLLLSPYLSEPVRLENDLLGTWVTLKVDIDLTGNLNFYVNNLLVASSSDTMMLSALGFAKHKVSVPFGLVSWEIETKAHRFSHEDIDTLLATASISLESVHPIYARAASEIVNTMNELKVWLLEDSGVSLWQAFNVPEETTRVAGAISNLRPITEYEMLVQLCDATKCLPAQYTNITTPGYLELTNWNNPIAEIGNSEGEVVVSFPINQLSGNNSFSTFGDSFTLSLTDLNNQETKELASFTFNQLLNTTATQDDYRMFSYLPDSLTPGSEVSFNLEVCNPIGCTESSDSYPVTVPVDSDGDGYIDRWDSFPNDPNEWEDYDGDGVGDNSDTDIDGDGIPNDVEIELGFNPRSTSDAAYDSDNDGWVNGYEYLAGSDFYNATDYPAKHGYVDTFEAGDESTLELDDVYLCEGCPNISDYAIFSSNYGDEDDKFSVTYRGKVLGGHIMFIASRRSFSLELTVNGEVVETDQLTSIYVRLYGYLFMVPVPSYEEDSVELKMTFTRESGSIWLDNIFIPSPPDELESARAVADFNGDGKSDYVFRSASNFTNYIKSSVDAQIQRVTFGKNVDDIPVEGDFDGDGISDIAVRRPSNYTWYVKRSSDDEIDRITFGKHEDDIPVPADYDGDGITDVAVRRPSNQMWYILQSSDNEIVRVNFGKQAQDIPVPADYDGDGKTDIAVRRPSTQWWYILRSSDGEIERHHFGKQEGDIPVPADYDGDGKADIAVRRPSSYIWYIKRSSDSAIERITFGKNEMDIPVVADYDGDGKADIAVRRPGTFYWYVLNSGDESISRLEFGRKHSYIPLMAPAMKKLEMLRELKQGKRQFGRDYPIGTEETEYQMEVDTYLREFVVEERIH